MLEFEEQCRLSCKVAEGSNMNNLIGIAGVFVLTFSLIALYHHIGAFACRSKRHPAKIRQLENSDKPRRTSPEQRPTSERDDSWLLWNRHLETYSGQSDRATTRRKGDLSHDEDRI